MARIGYSVFTSAGAARGQTGRVDQDSCIIVLSSFSRQYGLTHDNILHGHIHALRSTRKLSFLLVNTYFSSVSAAHRAAQYGHLACYLRRHRDKSPLIGGDQNRVDIPQGRWIRPTDTHPGRWGSRDERDSNIFSRQILQPFELIRAPDTHLGFRHRDGSCFAALDSFFILYPREMELTTMLSVQAVMTGYISLSDHDPLLLNLRPRTSGGIAVPSWICQDPLFTPVFASHLNKKARAEGFPEIMVLADSGIWDRPDLPPRGHPT